MSGFEVGVREKNKTWKNMFMCAVVVYAILVAVVSAYFSVFGEMITWKQTLLVLAGAIPLPCMMFQNKKHRIWKMVGSVLILALVGVLFYKRLYAGIVPHINSYTVLYNAYHHVGGSLINAETDIISNLLVIWFLGTMMSCILFGVLEVKKGMVFSVLVILIPVIVSAVVGKMPGTIYCWGLIATGCFYVILYHQSDNRWPIREWSTVSIVLLILFGISSIVQPVITAYKTENITAYQEMRKKLSEDQITNLKIFEDTVSKVKDIGSNYEGGGSSKGKLSKNASFNPTGETVMEIILEELPSQTIYLKSFVGSEYTGESWDEIGTFTFAEMISPIGGAEKRRALMNEPFRRLNEGTWQAAEKKMIIKLKNASKEFGYAPYYTEVTDAYDVHLDSYIEGNWSKTREYYYYSDIPSAIEWTSSYWYGDSESAVLSLLAEESDLWSKYQEFVKKTYVGDYPELVQLNEWCSGLEGLSRNEIGNDIFYIFQNEFEYSRNPGEMPSDMDLAEGFFFEKKTGFCMHFATTATLIYQICDIPARYVEGYAISPEQFKRYEDGTYRAVVTDESAHAWCEIFDEKIGWKPLEYTPSSGTSESRPSYSIHHLQTNSKEDDSQEDTQQEDELQEDISQDNTEDDLANDVLQGEEAEDNSQEENPTEQGGMIENKSEGNSAGEKLWKNILKKCGIVIGSLGLLLLGILLQQRVRRKRKRKNFRKKKENKGILNLYSEMYRLCAFAGLKDFGKSEKEAAEKMAEMFPVLSEAEWNWIYDSAEKAAFAKKVFSVEEQKEMYHLYQKLRKDILKNLNWRRKIWFLYGKAM